LLTRHRRFPYEEKPEQEPSCSRGHCCPEGHISSLGRVARGACHTKMKYRYTCQAHESSAQIFVPQLLDDVELCPFLISTTCSLHVEPPHMETPHADNDQGNILASTYIVGDELCLAPSTCAPGIEGQLIFEVPAARPNCLVHYFLALSLGSPAMKIQERLGTKSLKTAHNKPCRCCIHIFVGNGPPRRHPVVP